VCLREAVDLHVAVYAVPSLVVYTDTETSIADQRIEPGKLLRKLPGDLICLLEVFQVALPPFDLADITKLLQCFFRLICMLFLVREKVDLFGVVLKDVRNDAVAYARRPAGNDIYLYGA